MAGRVACCASLPPGASVAGAVGGRPVPVHRLPPARRRRRAAAGAARRRGRRRPPARPAGARADRVRGGARLRRPAGDGRATARPARRSPARVVAVERDRRVPSASRDARHAAAGHRADRRSRTPGAWHRLSRGHPAPTRRRPWSSRRRGPARLVVTLELSGGMGRAAVPPPGSGARAWARRCATAACSPTNVPSPPLPERRRHPVDPRRPAPAVRADRRRRRGGVGVSSGPSVEAARVVPGDPRRPAARGSPGRRRRLAARRGQVHARRAGRRDARRRSASR